MTDVLAMFNQTKPKFWNYLHTEAGNESNAVRQIEQFRRIRQTKFPSLRGKHDYASFQSDVNKDTAYKVWNDEGDHRAEAPFRSYKDSIDPTSGFMSAGGDVEFNTGHTQIRTLVQLSDVPQSGTPKEKNSIRVVPAAPQELRRSNTYAPGCPSMWNSKKISDAWIRSELGGWTSDYDPRKTPPPENRRAKSMCVNKPPTELNKNTRDHLALKCMYSPSTQRALEEIPWDTLLPPKKWQPVTTMEAKPDMVSHRWNVKRYDSAAQEWQAVGRGWDWFQSRNGYFRERPYTFCSANPRINQIPLYGGCVGAVNLEEIDNPYEAIQPLTVKRNTIPWPTNTAHEPNIPGYTGLTLYQGSNSPSHTEQLTSAVPKSAPSNDQSSERFQLSKSEFKRKSHMSKMITTVPPSNPFSSTEKDFLTVG